MSSFDKLTEAVTFSYNSSTWITWLVIVFGIFKTVEAFNKAYKDNKTYNDMIKNKDKTGIAQFYYGVIISILCIFVFFLPYILK